MAELIPKRSNPGMIISDNSLQRDADIVWGDWHRGHYIAPGEPMQHGYIESFIGGVRAVLGYETPATFSAERQKQ